MATITRETTEKEINDELEKLGFPKIASLKADEKRWSFDILVPKGQKKPTKEDIYKIKKIVMTHLINAVRERRKTEK